MQQLAKGIASLGRNNDTQLVHMTPGEVQGLQQLALSHGGSLTINPRTGLVEAGILERLLPSLASAAAYGMGMGPTGAAIAGGATTALQSNDLKKGITNGLIAYGLGNATEGLKGMGEEANALTQTEKLKDAGITQVGGAGAGQQPFANKAYSQYADSVQAGGGTPVGQEEFIKSPDFQTQQNAKIAEVAKSTPSNLQAGISKFGTSPWESTKELYGNMNKAGLLGLGAGAATIADRFSNKPATTAPAPVVTKPFTARYTPKTSFPTEEERRLLGSKEYNYFPTAAEGGSTEDIKGMAQGGIAALPNEYAAGGKLLSGAGDGMSDSIPAVIQGAKPQRAALADGEFVIPADVVSHLGNGSTKAGAQHLYNMMDKIRKARTGNHKQGKQINPHKFLTV